MRFDWIIHDLAFAPEGNWNIFVVFSEGIVIKFLLQNFRNQVFSDGAY